MGALTSKFWKNEPVKILFLGLDAAGKTSALYKLKLGEVVTTIPTIGFNVETIDSRKLNLSLNAWDVGGRSGFFRPLARHFYKATDGIIFMVDSADADRMPDAFLTLSEALQADELRGVPVVVLANKQDLPGALTADEVAETLNLAKLAGDKHPWRVMPCSVADATDKSLTHALEWLTQAIRDFKTQKELEKTVDETAALAKRLAAIRSSNAPAPKLSPDAVAKASASSDQHPGTAVAA